MDVAGCRAPQDWRATHYEVRALAHLIDARSSCTHAHARFARRYSDALAFTASDEGKAACANALRHLTFDSSSTAANDVHIGNVNTFYDAVVAAHSSAHADACFLTLATYIATAVPELCALHPRGAMELKNTAAQWIVQSGDSTGDGKRPFWDAGLKGEGQIVAVTDTGLAEDNCYFRDATGMVTPANDATSFDLSKRKVVQVSCKERTKSAHKKPVALLFTHVCGAHK